MKPLPLVLCLSLCTLAHQTFPANLQVANRSPKPDEWGYRPANGSIAPLNPPSFTWLLETQAESYTVQWSTTPDFRNAETVDAIPWPTYTHHTPLIPATYYWRYRFLSRDHTHSDWSSTRSVIIKADATPFPMPTRAQQLERIPKNHPRLFLRPEDLPKLRSLAFPTAPQPDRKSVQLFAQLKTQADRIIKAGPTPEPQHLGSARDKENQELIQYWWPNREQTLKACQEAETLAFVYLISGDRTYGQAARSWLLHLAAWDPDGPTNFKLNCEAAKPMLYRPARAYDWAWDMFTPADRDIIRAAMRRRLQDAWESGEVGRGIGHLSRPYNSHGNRVWHKIAEPGIVFLDEIPEAGTWLDYAVNKFYSCYPVWADDDGGWHEGVSYWAGYLGKSVWWLHQALPALSIDGLKKPFFAHVGDYPLYIAPPGSPNTGFGDLSFRPPSTGWGGFMEYFIRAKSVQPDGQHAAYWQWWTDQWHMREQDGILGFLYAATLPPLPSPKPPSDLPQSKIFHGLGVASLHTSLLDSSNDVHFLFKSSPFGSQSHGHNPQNSFQLNAYGEALLTTCVYRDLHGSKFHYQWAHSTLAHNAVLINGQGQTKHSAAARGRIVDAQLNPAWDYLVGDATDAYAGQCKLYRRHVAFLKTPRPVIVLCDELETAQPATFQFLLHALQPFSVDEAAAQCRLQFPKASLLARYFSPQPLSFRHWNGYEPAPTKSFPNQWHLQAATRQPQQQLQMITLLLPSPAGRTVDCRAERIDAPQAVGLQITLDGSPLAVAFRKSGASGPVQWSTNSFDGPILISRNPSQR